MRTKTNFPVFTVGFSVLVSLLIVGAILIFRSNVPPPISSPAERERIKAGALPIYGTVPDFSLTERSGAIVRDADLRGQVWIANFIFTRCAGVCPLMTRKMKWIQDRPEGSPNIRLVSFSVDPEHDTPQVLAEYAKKFSADPEQWLFLTGDKEKIYALSEQHFLLGVGPIPPEERQALDQRVRHSSRFVLVDPKLRIRGYYDSEAEGNLEDLVRDALSLLKSKLQ